MTEGAERGTGIDVKPANEWIGNILLVKYSTLTEALKVAGEALEEIAKDDDLVKANHGVFAIHAFKRVQEQAKEALAALERIRTKGT